MAKTSVSSWDQNPDNNTDINGINIAEGMSPADVNNGMRAMMAQIATLLASATKWLLTNDSTIQDTLATPANRLIGYRNIPLVAPRNASTLALGDMGMGHAFTGNITVPANATVAFPIEAVMTLINRTASAQTITPAAGVTLRLAGSTSTGARTVPAYSTATLWKIDTDEWWALGAGVS